MMKTVKECPKCKLRYVYWWFDDKEDICQFCKPKEKINDIQRNSS